MIPFSLNQLSDKQQVDLLTHHDSFRGSLFSDILNSFYDDFNITNKEKYDLGQALLTGLDREKRRLVLSKLYEGNGMIFQFLYGRISSEHIAELISHYNDKQKQDFFEKSFSKTKDFGYSVYLLFRKPKEQRDLIFKSLGDLKLRFFNFKIIDFFKLKIKKHPDLIDLASMRQHINKLLEYKETNLTTLQKDLEKFCKENPSYGFDGILSKIEGKILLAKLQQTASSKFIEEETFCNCVFNKDKDKLQKILSKSEDPKGLLTKAIPGLNKHNLMSLVITEFPEALEIMQKYMDENKKPYQATTKSSLTDKVKSFSTKSTTEWDHYATGIFNALCRLETEMSGNEFSSDQRDEKKNELCENIIKLDPHLLMFT